VDAKRDMVRHFLAAIAYRTQKALRDRPEGFGEFRTARGVRTPRELVRHMTSVLGYARTFFVGGTYRAQPLPTLDDEIVRLHDMLKNLSEHIAEGAFDRVSPEQLLQGPLSDAMSHAGQLALLRRLADSPVPPENFVVADISADNVGPNQADPVSPDDEWNTPGE
jgi:hypothetical protein